MRGLLRLTLLALLTVLAFPSKGAEIRCLNYADNNNLKTSCLMAYIEGQIVSGDYSRFENFYRVNHPYLSGIALNSSGGDEYEAMAIGRLLRRYYIEVIAPWHGHQQSLFSDAHLCEGEKCVCAGSCALIWFGSPTRTGEVGLHRPNMGLGFRDLSPVEAEKRYKPILSSITHYLEEMEVPKTFIEAMVSTSSSETYWTDAFRDYELLSRSPSYAEWLHANCGQFGEESEFKELFLLKQKGESSNLSQSEKRLIALLGQRKAERSNCEVGVVLNYKIKLEPPQKETAENPSEREKAKQYPAKKGIPHTEIDGK